MNPKSVLQLFVASYEYARRHFLETGCHLLPHMFSLELRNGSLGGEPVVSALMPLFEIPAMKLDAYPSSYGVYRYL